MTTLARVDDVVLERDEMIAAGFLVRYGEPTRTLYTTNLRQWFEWCAARGIAPLDAQRAHIEVWGRELQELRKLKVSTVANKLNTVCNFYKLARIDGYITVDPAEYVRRPTVPKVSTREALTRSELLHCCDIAAKSGRSQDHAIWCVLAFNGLRVGELVALNVEDLSRSMGYRTIYVNREKNNRSAHIPLAPRTSWAIEQCIAGRTSGPLFRVRTEERIDRKGVDRVIQRICREAGVTHKRITPHSLRHTSITLALHAGAHVRDIANGMGYADTKMVSYYDRDRDSLSRNPTHLLAAYVEGA